MGIGGIVSQPRYRTAAIKIAEAGLLVAKEVRSELATDMLRCAICELGGSPSAQDTIDDLRAEIEALRAQVANRDRWVDGALP